MEWMQQMFLDLTAGGAEWQMSKQTGGGERGLTQISFLELTGMILFPSSMRKYKLLLYKQLSLFDL